MIRLSQVAQNRTTNLPATPQTPQSRKRRLSANLSITTPKNKFQFNASLSVISQQEPISRGVRTLLSKVGKAIDRFHIQSAQTTQQSQAYELQISELRNKRRKKVPIDANKNFADIEKIKAVQDEQERQRDEWNKRDQVAEARRTANAMLASQMTRFQHEFRVNSVVDRDI